MRYQIQLRNNAINTRDVNDQGPAKFGKLNDESSDFKNDNVQYRQQVQRISEDDTVRETSTDGTDRQQRRNDRQASKRPRFLSR